MLKEIIIRNLHLLVADDYVQMSDYSADLIYGEIKNKKDLLICAATGSTPIKTYEVLSKKYNEDHQAFQDIRIIKLDEWMGIPMDNPATCEAYLQKRLISPLDIDSSRFISFTSNPENPEQETKRISKILNDSGDIDLCILGMGINGHLGFNEPAEYLNTSAHIAKLADTTKKHSMVLESEQELKYGFTLGLNDIMRSKKILLVVNGSHKKEPFKKFLSTKITNNFPVSMLWMHPNVTIVCDREVVPDIDKINI
jgi:galactosamine-6-phosphate isomerase